MVEEISKINDNLIEEYKMTQQFIMHYEKMIWYIGSILNASILALAGLILSRPNGDYFLFVVLISIVISFVWYKFECRYRSINRLKYSRMHRIENELGFSQSLDVKRMDEENNRLFKGHTLITILCFSIPALLFLIWLNLRLRLW